jgi:8-oxo-dGTP pyrophosphatase MutT (NUDIX family)
MQPEAGLHVHPELATLKETLELKEDTLPPIPEPEEERTHAAVAVVFREGPEPELLLIRRAKSETDPWSGQMALPGGRRDPSDHSLLQTAVRETAEETSVLLDRDGFPMGRLEAVTPATRRLPPISIYPFVFAVPAATPAEAASREVDEVLWVPLSSLGDPEARDTVEIVYKDQTSREFPCLKIQGRVVWGLTYRILTGLMELLRGGPEDDSLEP